MTDKEKAEEIQEAVEDVADAPSFAVPLQILRGISAVLFMIVCAIW